ncbi:MAG TPA: integrase core domain-containing protein [Pararhizobium sp.]|nr:integrase core domain-containing protein [Pararhizobium sp.]
MARRKPYRQGHLDGLCGPYSIVNAFDLVHPLDGAVVQGTRRWAKRLRGALKAKRPGEAVQVDTLSLSFPDGKSVKQFTAVDRVSRWSVGMAAARATATSAARFLDKLIAEAPFPVRALQIDGGSEFKAEFEQACEAKGIALWVLPPRSPELNGRVERMQATWRYEFYAVDDPPRQLDRLNPLIDAFANRYNTYRPHDALGQRTPNQYSNHRAPESPRRLLCAEPGQSIAMPSICCIHAARRHHRV